MGTLLGVYQPAQAQKTSSKYFDSTGHNVADEFLAFYLTPPDPLLVYGLPKTEVFIDPVQNIKMQYFQRARFEYHPDAPAGKRVQLSLLGTLTYQQAKVQAVYFPTTTPQCRPYGQYFVCYAFKAFFDAHGGLAQFGTPISNYVKEGDQYVQYFERARFEYHPDLPNNVWVTLTDIGRIQFDQSHRDYSLLNPVGPISDSPLPQVTSLNIKAYVTEAVIKANSLEGVTVIVLDQGYRPVVKALVAIKLTMPDGSQIPYNLQSSDENGISRLEGIHVGAIPANQRVLIEVDVTNNDLRATTTTWFHTWW